MQTTNEIWWQTDTQQQHKDGQEKKQDALIQWTDRLLSW